MHISLQQQKCESFIMTALDWKEITELWSTFIHLFVSGFMFDSEVKSNVTKMNIGDGQECVI